MKRTQELLLVPFAATMASLSGLAHAQSAQELDLTMQVIREGEVPAGLINRIELPPPEFFDALQNSPELSDTDPVNTATDDTVEISSEIEDRGADVVRETISIDGTVDADNDSDGVINVLPETITDILDDTLPLDNPLDSIDDTVGLPVDDIVDVFDDPADDVIDTAGDVIDTAGDVVDGVTDTVGDVSGTVADTTEDAAGNAADTVDDVADTLNDSVSDITDDSGDLSDVSNLVDSLGEDNLDLIDEIEPESVSDELEDVIQPDPTEDLIEDVTDGLPGI